MSSPLRHTANIYACAVGRLAETCYSIPNLSLCNSPTLPGGGREHAGISGATGRMTVEGGGRCNRLHVLHDQLANPLLLLQGEGGGGGLGMNLSVWFRLGRRFPVTIAKSALIKIWSTMQLSVWLSWFVFTHMTAYWHPNMPRVLRGHPPLTMFN